MTRIKQKLPGLILWVATSFVYWPVYRNWASMFHVASLRDFQLALACPIEKATLWVGLQTEWPQNDAHTGKKNQARTTDSKRDAPFTKTSSPQSNSSVHIMEWIT